VEQINQTLENPSRALLVGCEHRSSGQAVTFSSMVTPKHHLEKIVNHNHREAHRDAIYTSKKVRNTFCQQCLALQVDSM